MAKGFDNFTNCDCDLFPTQVHVWQGWTIQVHITPRSIATGKYGLNTEFINVTTTTTGSHVQFVGFNHKKSLMS